MNPYGIRVAVNMVTGLLMCLLWLAVFYTRPTGWPVAAEINAFGAWSVAGIYFISYLLPDLRSRFNLPVALSIAAGALLLQSLVLSQTLDYRVYGELWSNAYVPTFLLIGPMLINSLRDHAWRNQWFRETFRMSSGDNSEWMTRRDYHKYAYAIPKYNNGVLGWSSRLYLGMSRLRHDFKSRHIGVKTDVHMCTIGMSGSGKSTTVAWINQALLAASMFIVDMKGEHARVCGRRREELGDVWYCDPFGVTGKKGHQYNPLFGINVLKTEGLLRISQIANAIVMEESHTLQGGHFSDNARTIVEGVICYVIVKYPRDLRNLVTVYWLLSSCNPATGEMVPDLFDKLIAKMSQCKYGQCAAAAKLILDAGDNEGGSFQTTISKSIKWLQAPAMQHFFSGHDFNMESLGTDGDRKPTIYVALGLGNEQEYLRFLRVMTAVAIFDVQQAYKRTGKKPDPSVVFSLDEYPLYAKGLECISTGFGTLRETCTLWVQAQQRSQIVGCLGKENAEALFENSTIQIFGVSNDYENNAKWIKALLGEHRVTRRRGPGIWAEKVSSTVEPLMTERGVQDALPQHGRGQFIFPADNPRPMWADRCQHMPFKIDGVQCWKSLNLGPVFDS